MLEGSILQKLSTAHDPKLSTKRPLSFGVYYKNTLVSLCHALEDCILDSTDRPLVVTAFQRGKWYLQEADRYADLARKARQVGIMAADDAGFAEHPTSQLPNVDTIAIDPTDPVSEEWHLIIFGPAYAAMVLCQELSPADYGASGVPEDDLARKFYGFWTFESNLVEETIELAIAHIGRYNPSLQAKLAQQMQSVLAERATLPPQPLERVVSKVVAYLQKGQDDLGIDRSDTFLDDNLLSNELQAFLRMAQIIDGMSPENPKAPEEVAALAETLGQLLDLPGWQLKRLRLAGILHRLGPMQGAESLFSPSKPVPTDYPACPLTCALEPGAQALRTMPRLRAVAQIVTHQTEWWNGQGAPAGLAADDIPLEARILGISTYFQGLVGSLEVPQKPEARTVWFARLQAALAQCQQESGRYWDPKLVELLALLVSGLHQGMALSIQSPKFTNGLWLLDALPTEADPSPHRKAVEVGYGN
ncbi:DICT sensory domain-containing protein [Altericista sp. CCNU0014]|uniref:DICT sensory domain-containing protein n=1 Tax=Altericista sp. CCNU0014 TaxID=3082949 RepID=UPI00384EE463